MVAARRIRRTLTTAIVFTCALLIACAAIVAVTRLQADATERRDAELKLVELRLNLAQIQDVPWGASPDEGDDPQAVRDELRDAQDGIEATLAELSRDGGLPEHKQ